MSVSKLWDKVLADYVQHWQGPPTSRSPQALQSHFRGLKTMLKVWHNAQITSRNRIASGTNRMDEENQTQSIFMKKYKNPFVKDLCWDKVKHHPYFVDPPCPPPSYSTPTSYSTPAPYSSPPSPFQNESPIDLDDEVVIETPTSSISRPIGIKKAKEAKRKGKKTQDAAESMALAIQSMAESTQASVELVKKRNEEMAAHTKKVFEFEEAKEDARIMAMDTSTWSPERLRWIKSRRTSIMAKTLFDGGSNDADGSNDGYIPHFD